MITIQDFQNRVKISSKIEDKDINPSIIYAQEMKLSGLVCGLYDVLIDQCESCTYESRITYLLEKYIKPYLVYEAYADYLLTHNINGTLQGLVSITGDNTQTIGKEQIEALTSMTQDRANNYAMRLVAFLKNNVDYPEFDCECNDEVNLFRISGIGQTSDQNDLFI